MKKNIKAQKKRQGKAQGESFELDLATWFLIDQYIKYQAHKASDYSFNFFPGFDDIEKLEDIVIRYERNAQERIIFVQAKHVLEPNQNLTDQALFLLNGDYSLLMYCNAYLKAKNNPDLLRQIEYKNLNSNVEFKDVVEECILATSKGVTSQYLIKETNNQKLNIGNRELYKPHSIKNELIKAFKAESKGNQDKLTELCNLDASELAEGIDEFLGKLIFVTNLPRQGTVGNNLENIIKNEQIGAKIKIGGKLLEQAEINDYFNALQYLIFRRKGENKTLITPKELDELFSDQKQKLDELLINRAHSKKLEALGVSFTEESIKDLRDNKLQDFLLPEKRVLNIITSGKTAKVGAADVLRDLQALKMQQLTIQDLATLPTLEMLTQSIIQPKTSKNQYTLTLFKQNDLHLVFIEGTIRQNLKETLETIISTKDFKFKAIFISTINLLEKAKSKDALKQNPLYKFFEDLNKKSLYESIALEHVAYNVTIKEFITEKKQILPLVSLDSMELGYAKLNQILCDPTMNTNDVLFIDLDSLLKNHSKFLSILSKYGKFVIECNTSIVNASNTTLLSSLLQNNVEARIILLTKQGFNVQDILPNQEAESYPIKHNFIDLIRTDQENLLTRKLLIFLGNKEKISLKELMGISDLDKYLSDAQNQDIINQMIPTTKLVELIKNEDIKIGSDSTGTSDLVGAYAQLYQDINIERLINNLLLDKENIFVISGINGSKKSKSFIDKLKAFDTGLQVDNIDQNQISDFHPDTKHNTRILLDDDKLQEKHFKQLCLVNENKKIYWISLKDGSDNESQFILQQIYNPDFYVDRQFNHFKKVIIKEDIYKELQVKSHNESQQRSDIFLFTGIDNQDDLLKLFPAYSRKLIQQNMNDAHPRVIAKKRGELSQFDQLVVQNKTIHWLNIEQNNGNTQIVWIKSRGTLDNLRKYINNEKSIKLTLDKDFINDIKDKQTTIIADDPGMGKTTSLTKLCTLQYDLGSEVKSIFQSHWVISVDLKDHISTIGRIKSSNIKIDDIINLCLESDSDLNTTFAKKILLFAFQNTNFIKPILIKFDGFDEVLDQNIRNNLISLMQYLKYDPNVKNVKFWITSRLHYEQTLENKLSIFATKFEPLNDQKNKEFIYQFFKNRLHLTLSKKQFNDTFGDNAAKVHEKTNKVSKYAEAFLIKMKDIFKGDNAKFIGTPLQLYLMLEIFLDRFIDWLKSDGDLDIHFSYLGNNIAEVYHTFINKKYETYFNKKLVKEVLKQEQEKIIFDQYHANFAKSLTIQSKVHNNLAKFTDLILLVGIIKSQGIGNNIEFIHPTFREYFAAQAFTHWVEKEQHKLSNNKKQEYLLTEILMHPCHQMIRTFFNHHLLIIRTHYQYSTLIEYGKKIEELWSKKLLQNDEEFILYITAREGNVKIISFLLDSLIEYAKHDITKNFINFVIKDGWTALHWAARAGQLEVVQSLIEQYKADVHAKAKDDWTVLHSSAQCGALDVIQYLLKHIKIDAVTKNGCTVLHFAAQSGKFETVKFLVETGDAKVDATDKNGNTILHFAVKSGKLEVVQYLVDTKGADIHAIANDGRTILHSAAKCSQAGALEVIKYLVDEKGANINSTTNDEKTILHYAAGYGRLETVKYLVEEKHADIHATTNKTGWSVLHSACCFGKLEVIKYLVDTKGADIHAIANDGRTILHSAAKCSQAGALEVIKYLVDEKGADIHAIANDGETILHYAAGYGRLETVKYLVEEKHADIHAIANDGRTILHSAAKCSQAGALEVIKYLVDKKGANINITTSDGKGLSDVASSQVEVIQYLEAKNVNITQDALSSSEAFSDDAVLMGVTD